jgi:hypothetical protein
MSACGGPGVVTAALNSDQRCETFLLCSQFGRLSSFSNGALSCGRGAARF